MPLAIELAAARLRLLSPEALLEQLKNRLGVLRSGPRDLPERQQTLRSTMDWSYDLLKPAEQRLFEFLAVFADADIMAVEELAGRLDRPSMDLAADVLDGLTSLIEKSLIRRIDLPNGETRVAMLETIREFAAERLNQRPELGREARQAHAGYYADFARARIADLGSAKRAEALAAMTIEVGNLRIAWHHWVKAADLGQLEKLTDSLLILNDARGWYLDTVGLTTDMLTVLAATSTKPERIHQEIALRTSLARALATTKGFTPEVEEAFSRAVEIFERNADVRQQFSVLRALTSIYQLRGQLDKAVPLVWEVLALAERTKDPRMLIDGHLVVGALLMFVNDLEGGLAHLDTAIGLIADVPKYGFGVRGNDPRVTCYTTSALTLLFLGYPDRAVERANGALALADELDHPFTRAFARFHASLVDFWRRDAEAAVKGASLLLEMAEKHDFKIWTAAGTCLLGVAQTGLGRFGEGLRNVQDGMALYQGIKSPPVFWPMLLSLSATASLFSGRPVDGVRPIDEAIAIMGAGDGASLEPDFLIIKGDLLAAIAAGEGRDASESESVYQRAFDRAARMKGRMAQLRAATRLCRLWRSKGDPDAARLLAPVYAEFTEGFAAPDLIEARELLGATAERPS